MDLVFPVRLLFERIFLVGRFLVSVCMTSQFLGPRFYDVTFTFASLLIVVGQFIVVFTFSTAENVFL